MVHKVCFSKDFHRTNAASRLVPVEIRLFDPNANSRDFCPRADQYDLVRTPRDGRGVMMVMFRISIHY